MEGYNCTAYDSCTSCLIYPMCMWCAGDEKCGERNETNNMPVATNVIAKIAPGTWDELVPFVIQCCQSAEPSHRESGLSIIGDIAQWQGDKLAAQAAHQHSAAAARERHSRRSRYQRARLRGCTCRAPGRV